MFLLLTSSAATQGATLDESEENSDEGDDEDSEYVNMMILVPGNLIIDWSESPGALDTMSTHKLYPPDCLLSWRLLPVLVDPDNDDIDNVGYNDQCVVPGHVV